MSTSTPGLSAAQLDAEARKARAIADELAQQALAARRAEDEARKPTMPSVEDGPAFLAFTRYLSGREYTYAAVGWRVGRSVRWMVTGTGSGSCGSIASDRYNWPGLLGLIGEANWSSIVPLTPGEPLLSPGSEPPVAERMGAYGRVESTHAVNSPFDRY